MQARMGLFIGYLTLNLFLPVVAYRIMCGAACVCDIKEDLVIAECNGRQLVKLPSFDRGLAPLLTRVYLNDNLIKELNETVLSTWVSLGVIDLMSNPLHCSQLGKIKEHVKILSNCEQYTTPDIWTTHEMDHSTSTCSQYETTQGKCAFFFVFVLKTTNL